MNKDKLNLMYGTFKHSALSQLKRDDTFAIAAAAGLYQGLKYKGSIVRAIKACAATAVGLAVLNGVQNVVVHWDKIKGV